MTENVKSIPDGYHSINVYIALTNATKAIQFYKDAFSAVEKSKFVMPDG